MTNQGAQTLGNPVPAVDPASGNLYVVWEQRGTRAPKGQPPNVNHLYFVRSTDAGATWSDPYVVIEGPHEGSTEYYTYTNYPGISVAPNGRVDVGWSDFRNDHFVGTTTKERYWDVYYAYSSDGGASWSPNTRVTPSSIDGQKGTTFGNSNTLGPMGIASSNDAAYIAWADTRASAQAQDGDAEDAYLARVRFTGAATSRATTAGTDTSVKVEWSLVGAIAVLILGGGALLTLGLLARRRRR